MLTEQFGLTDMEVRNWTNGPAFLTWSRGQNSHGNGIGGPLPRSFMQGISVLFAWAEFWPHLVGQCALSCVKKKGGKKERKKEVHASLPCALTFNHDICDGMAAFRLQGSGRCRSVSKTPPDLFCPASLPTFS